MRTAVTDSVEKKEAREIVQQALNTLPSRVRKVMRMYYGMEKGLEDRPHTYEEIGEQLGVTRERVRQLIDRGLRMLQHPARIKKLQAANEEIIENEPALEERGANIEDYVNGRGFKSIEAAATFVGISVSTLVKWVELGIPVSCDGGHTIISRDNFIDWLKERLEEKPNKLYQQALYRLDPSLKDKEMLNVRA